MPGKQLPADFFFYFLTVCLHILSSKKPTINSWKKPVFFMFARGSFRSVLHIGKK